MFESKRKKRRSTKRHAIAMPWRTTHVQFLQGLYVLRRYVQQEPNTRDINYKSMAILQKAKLCNIVNPKMSN